MERIRYADLEKRKLMFVLCGYIREPTINNDCIVGYCSLSHKVCKRKEVDMIKDYQLKCRDYTYYNEQRR